MIPLDSIRGFFPPSLRLPAFNRHMLKEYVECLALEWIARSPWAGSLTFIGGTSLRLILGIDRFSEDLDFDIKELDAKSFRDLTDGLVAHLARNGLPAASKDHESERLTALRRSIVFPGFLHDLGLSPFKEERFLMKVEAQDQGLRYERETAHVNRCGFFFPVCVPPEPVLCAMKLSALLTRGKGRDFYDAIFLLQRTMPDYGFLSASHPGVTDKASLKLALTEKAMSVNLELKRRDVEHLLFNRERAAAILNFKAFVASL
jgi:predicted nucleotidyltransferase component of viral defense system